MEKIALDKCRDGYLYRLSSRNLSIGVFKEISRNFVGIREKFGSRYLDSEYHWDVGPPHGTAEALEELEHCPIMDLSEGYSDGKVYKTNQELFKWLQEKEEKYLEG